MRLNLDYLLSLSQGQLLDAVKPLHITQTFFRLMITTVEDLAEEYGGDMPTDEPTMLTYLNRLAKASVDGLQDHELGGELVALHAHARKHDLRPAFSFRLISFQPLSVVDVLRTTLQEIYVAMLHTVLFAQGLAE